MLVEEELRPEEELFGADALEVDRPLELPPLALEELLLPEAVDLLPPDDALLREELLLPEVALLSFAEEPLDPELLPPLLLPEPDEAEVLELVLLLVVPLPDDAAVLEALLAEVPLFEDSLLELLSLGVPPVERLVPELLFDAVAPPLLEVFWLEVFFVCAWPDCPFDAELFWLVLFLLEFSAIINGFYLLFQNICHGSIKTPYTS